jgi:DNA mismatch repair protein MutL
MGEKPASARMSQFAMDVQRTGEPAAPLAPGAAPLPPLRVLGQLGRLYIIGEGPDGLYLIDQHAAHERVLYDQLAAATPAQVASQRLLAPVPVELTARQAVALDEALPKLTALGFEIEPFGDAACLVRAIPSALGSADAARIIRDALDELGLERPPAVIGDRTIAVVACHAAIREGKVLALEEMQALVRQLERTAMPRTCPHSRPTVLHLSLGVLEREFRR